MAERGNYAGIENAVMPQGAALASGRTDTEREQVKEVDRKPTEEETKNFIRMNEEDMIQGLISAACFASNDDEQKTIEIARPAPGGETKVLFRFRIVPLREEQYEQAKKKHTSYVKNKQFGMKLPQETNSTRYRSQLIYMATVEEDRSQLWDNKHVWDALRSKGLQIMNGLDVIEYSLKAGEKERILNILDEISGYDSNLEEVAKN